MIERFRNGTALAGLLLVALGIIFLTAQFLNLPFWHYGWPLIIVALGILVLGGAATGGRNANPLAIPGAMLLVLGLVLFYQVISNHWASWAYAWALVAPTGVGLGMLWWSRWDSRPWLPEVGKVLVLIGVTIFIVAGSLFEMLLAMLGANSPGRLLWPLGLVLTGLLLLFGRPLVKALWPQLPSRWSIVDAPVKDPAPRSAPIVKVKTGSSEK